MDIASLLGPEPAYLPAVRANMVSTLTGSATINDLSEAMGNDTDAQLFQALRGWADVVFVGGQTVRSEDYAGVERDSPDSQPAPIAVPTQSLKFDPGSKFLTHFTTAPLFLLPHAALQSAEVSARKRSIEAAGAEVIDAGEGTMQDYLRVLRERGFQRILCEGGPGMLGQLVHIDAIDQMYLTLDPHLSTGVEKPVATFHGTHSHRRMQLENIAADTDSTVFLRYSRTTESVD
ncbi:MULTISPECIES: pyrimidine reductase family protein [unclassified Corynebacterium]|uniref:pyrimidine reductase family protein n=1 Tax=Corynebacterium TaxID=1716 RepID=UPI002549D40D|nr:MULTISPECIES: pyrimidine reductase family protein [unclassified Corynebacterium]MDK8466567.1 pyrimidine reductase family protein [Corynebacterium sp. MSK130]MDK8687122.1 pyrimidine reductase family protein [Corynebacterium sp. MSK122]MDK8701521.1 pyrimidine reductase family protein [Corynebacterium sp. MSK107]MDK8703801.1 pyrimidine reductase family protein [Corynebacterium sp. MSK090]